MKKTNSERTNYEPSDIISARILNNLEILKYVNQGGKNIKFYQRFISGLLQKRSKADLKEFSTCCQKHRKDCYEFVSDMKVLLKKINGPKIEKNDFQSFTNICLEGYDLQSTCSNYMPQFQNNKKIKTSGLF